MLKPQESIDYMFIRTFCEEDDSFDADLPLIVRDFLIHENEKLVEYSQFIYADDSLENSGAVMGFRYKFLNLLLSAARHGSDHAAEMLCRIYKIYYRKEYNQLKRFKNLSYDELLGFETEEEMFETTAARILTIAPFMGIEVDPECHLVNDDIKEVLEDRTFDFMYKPEDFSFKEGLFPQAQQDAKELLERFGKNKPRYYSVDGPVRKFMWKVYEYHQVPSDFDLLCESHFESDLREYSVTIALLRSVWPNKIFTDEEIRFYKEIYRLLTIMIEHMIVLDENIDLMIGREDKFRNTLENSRYKPEKEKVARSIASGKAEPVKKPDAVPVLISDEEKARFYAEIETLQASNRAKEQTIRQLNRLYKEALEREKQHRVDTESWEGDREELIRLRESLYQMTEEDMAAVVVSMEEMESELRNWKIAIVGGHDNWTGYLKEKFPSWTYIKPGISNTVPESVVMNVEYLFFFTDTISHGAYGKYLKTVRTHGIPFGYLHGTNIPETVRQIYRAVTAENS